MLYCVLDWFIESLAAVHQRDVLKMHIGKTFGIDLFLEWRLVRIIRKLVGNSSVTFCSLTSFKNLVMLIIVPN